MNQMRLWAAAAIILLVVVIGFALSVPRTGDLALEPAPTEDPVIPAVTFTDSFRRSVHTISGSVVAPNACAIVSATASVTGEASTTQGILVALSLTTDEGVCLQLPTPTKFETTVTAPAALPITVTVNGVVATTTP
jgi:hypothetical protein